MKAGMTRREVLGSLGFMALASRVGFGVGTATAEIGRAHV